MAGRNDEIFDFLYGRMNDSEQSAFKARMARDSELAAEVDAERRLNACLDNLGAPEVSYSQRERILNAASKIDPSERLSDADGKVIAMPRRWIQVAAIAACVVLALVAGIVIGSDPESSNDPDTAENDPGSDQHIPGTVDDLSYSPEWLGIGSSGVSDEEESSAEHPNDTKLNNPNVELALNLLGTPAGDMLLRENPWVVKLATLHSDNMLEALSNISAESLLPDVAVVTVAANSRDAKRPPKPSGNPSARSGSGSGDKNHGQLALSPEREDEVQRRLASLDEIDQRNVRILKWKLQVVRNQAMYLNAINESLLAEVQARIDRIKAQTKYKRRQLMGMSYAWKHYKTRKPADAEQITALSGATLRRSVKDALKEELERAFVDIYYPAELRGEKSLDELLQSGRKEEVLAETRNQIETTLSHDFERFLRFIENEVGSETADKIRARFAALSEQERRNIMTMLLLDDAGQQLTGRVETEHLRLKRHESRLFRLLALGELRSWFMQRKKSMHRSSKRGHRGDRRGPRENRGRGSDQEGREGSSEKRRGPEGRADEDEGERERHRGPGRHERRE